jgi:hypothetical protein
MARGVVFFALDIRASEVGDTEPMEVAVDHGGGARRRPGATFLAERSRRTMKKS